MEDFANGLRLLQGVATAVTAAPPTTNIKAVQEEPATQFPHAKRKKIRMGPYRLPSTNESNVQSVLFNSPGMTDIFKFDELKPCDSDTCVLLTMRAGLEYADGKDANTDTGSWLHHTVLINTGPGVKEPNCNIWPIEDLFQSGNERQYSGFALNTSSMKTGYQIKKEDKFLFVTELMNMNEEPKWVWLTMSYEYLDGPQPDVHPAHMLYQTIGTGCQVNKGQKNPFGNSNISETAIPHKGLDKFSESSFPWTSPYDGTVIAAGGHLHDGGEDVQIFVNGDVICDSRAIYGKGGAESGGMRKRRPSHVRRHVRRQDEGMEDMPGMGGESEGGHSHGSTGDGQEHVVRMDDCSVGKPLKKGDKLWLTVNYDFTKHPG